MQHEGSLPVFGVILAHVPKRCVHTRACDLVAMVVTVRWYRPPHDPTSPRIVSLFLSRTGLRQVG